MSVDFVTKCNLIKNAKSYFIKNKNYDKHMTRQFAKQGNPKASKANKERMQVKYANQLLDMHQSPVLQGTGKAVLA